MDKSYFPAEWVEQDAVQLTWPTEHSDWGHNFKEVESCYLEVANAILRFENLILVAEDIASVKGKFNENSWDKIVFVEATYNDTWARDHGGISIYENGKPVLLDFKFNGWGNKYKWEKDNLITQKLVKSEVFHARVEYRDQMNFVLEGGAIESNGKGDLLITKSAVFNTNRNSDQQALKNYLKNVFSVKNILELEHASLLGDDTDGHIDTLARFVNESTIVYVQCKDESYPRFSDLKKMEKQLKSFTNSKGELFKVVALPHVNVRDKEGEYLPATYANFLIINRAVLVPIYGLNEDEVVLGIFENLFPDREIIGINCLSLIQQNGSLHCITMQYPKGFVK